MFYLCIKMYSKKIAMQNLFLILSAKEFRAYFRDRDSCLEYLSEVKWAGGFRCRRCGNTNFCHGKAPFSRRCTRCKHEESATAHTFFHRCHIPLQEAFQMVHMVCNNPGLSSYELSKIFSKRQMTCWRMKSRIIRCKDRNGEFFINGESSLSDL